MSDHADQFARGVAGEACIAVERDAIADARQNLDVSLGDHEAGVGRPAQQAIEFFDLAALALPSHPERFALVPVTLTMKKVENITAVAAVLLVERPDAGARGFENCGVGG